MANYKKGRGGYARRKREHRQADGVGGRAKRLQARREAHKSGRRGWRSANRSRGFSKKKN